MKEFLHQNLGINKIIRYFGIFKPMLFNYNASYAYVATKATIFIDSVNLGENQILRGVIVLSLISSLPDCDIRHSPWTMTEISFHTYHATVIGYMHSCEKVSSCYTIPYPIELYCKMMYTHI